MGLELLFFTQICVGILMFIFLHKITQMKRQVDNITKEVQNYITFITEDTIEEEVDQKKESAKRENMPLDETKSNLIHAVLSEYFP